ncbi:hypothetical protein H112_05594 [Trichophyton rubrum D6]|uniref:Uncharacterized protein n=3 Tax=Trichophyton TaxID=5550 RepID=F2SJW9_TRIRC|nr:uncharacterized protein TERG_03323 [Trichophyton rubrum CBS 118892]EZF16590.1 hypothetical protein H100_05612 [Trichophyton rubrum MR850]EZF40269.1 hypothetical protein H102_05579 [Trichophyton rubrum CBS 100081]EZF51094.1 hypothetical protein H103_05602 [Trichophyton rubrum CBS 288.86]EZF61494.1 hypothetical protein H104_05593 [Trichophyton rubrum CBS 289.86]EZF72256.1 hypothetical protein H105_05620 [Trichophyton soudanense CBS 452.61]EZF82915.1 hypothetical protein H110_05602 [Trichophy
MVMSIPCGITGAGAEEQAGEKGGEKDKREREEWLSGGMSSEMGLSLTVSYITMGYNKRHSRILSIVVLVGLRFLSSLMRKLAVDLYGERNGWTAYCLVSEMLGWIGLVFQLTSMLIFLGLKQNLGICVMRLSQRFVSLTSSLCR